MANEVYGRTWKIDTPAGGVLHAGPFRVKSVRWVSPSAEADHEARVADSLGNILWKSRAAGANHVDESILDAWWNQGWQVPVLSSGELYVTVL